MCRCEVSVCVVVALLVGVSVCYDEYDISNQIHTQSNVQQIAILDKLTALDERIGSLDQRLTAIDQRMSASDQRMNSFDERVHDLSAGPGLQGVPSSGPQIPMTTTTAMPDIPFRITRVTKHESDDSFEVKIEYQASSKPVVYMTTRYSGQAPTVLDEQEMGVLELTVPKRSEPEREQDRYYGPEDATVLFLVSDIYHSATLRLYNTSDNMEVPSIELIVPQGHELRHKPGGKLELNVAWLMVVGGTSETFGREGGYCTIDLLTDNASGMADACCSGNRHELKYEPGSKLELNFAWTVGGDMEAIEQEDGYYTITVKSDVEDNVVNKTFSGSPGRRSGKPIWVEEVSLNGEQGKWRGSGLINSTLIDPEGVLDAFPYVRFNCAVNCLLKEFTIQYRVSFYRSDHSGPFPENFLGFVNEGDAVSSTVSYCEIGDAPDGNVTCTVRCNVMGTLPSHTRISKVLSDGRVQTVTDALMQSHGDQSYAMLQVHNVGYADRDVYRCTATSDVSEISKDITLAPIKSPVIDRNASRVVKHKNGTLTGVCVASGVPTPNISFTKGVYNTLINLSPDLYDVTVTHPDQWTTRAELVIADVDAANRVYSLECNADNVPEEVSEEQRYQFSDSHYMSMWD